MSPAIDWVTPFAQLLALVNPLAAMPYYLRLLRHAPPWARERAARTSALATAAVLVGSALGGARVLALLGVSLPCLQVSGGLLLLVQALAMLQGQATDAGARHAAGPDLVADPDPASRRTAATPPASEAWRHGVLMPLTVPLLVGPATVGLVVARVGPAAPTAALAAWAGLGLAVGGCVYAVFRAAAPLQRLLDDAGVRLLGQLGALVLAALAVGSIAAGLGGLFPALGAAHT